MEDIFVHTSEKYRILIYKIIKIIFMKNIINFINESNNGWTFYKSVYDPTGKGLKLDGFDNTDVKWIYININDYSICPYTEDDVKQATKDLEDDYLEKELHKLKIGDSYNDEGNVYLRIK